MKTFYHKLNITYYRMVYKVRYSYKLVLLRTIYVDRNVVMRSTLHFNPVIFMK